MPQDLQFGRFFRLQVDTLITTELDIVFKVTKTLKKEPNTLDLTIFNLNDTHRQQLQEKESPVIQLEAGYQDKNGVIFLGDIRDVWSEKSENDWVTTLSSGDGEKATQFDRINKSFAAGTSLPAVIEEVAKSMGDIGIGNLKAIATSGKLPGGGGAAFVNGVTVSGNASRELNRIVRSAGLEWSIQDKTFQLLEAGQALQTKAVELTPESGLIGSPTIGNDGVLNFTALLNSDILPGKQLEVKSALIDGRFRVERCDYIGDTAGNDWYVQGEAKELDI